MSRFHSFGGSLVFAALAAAGLLCGALALAPALSLHGFVILFVGVVTPLYLAGIAPSFGRAIVGGGIASLLTAGLWLLPFGIHGTAAGAAAVVAVVRSGVLYRQRPARAILTEAVLGGAGLALAAFLASGGVGSLALGVWGYFLVQSTYFLVGGLAPRGDVEDEPVDPFERSRASLEALLE